MVLSHESALVIEGASSSLMGFSSLAILPCHSVGVVTGKFGPVGHSVGVTVPCVVVLPHAPSVVTDPLLQSHSRWVRPVVCVLRSPGMM
jgi:hypothetical protein